MCWLSPGDMGAVYLYDLVNVGKLHVTIISWFRGEYQGLFAAAKQAFSDLSRIFCGQPISTQSTEHGIGRRPAGRVRQRKTPRGEQINQVDGIENGPKHGRAPRSHIQIPRVAPALKAHCRRRGGSSTSPQSPDFLSISGRGGTSRLRAIHGRRTRLKMIGSGHTFTWRPRCPPEGLIHASLGISPAFMSS
jgi:hypothetical protein